MRPFSEYVAIIAGQKHPVRFLASRVLWRTGLSKHLVLELGELKLRFYPSAMSATYWVDPDARRADHAFFRSYLRPGDVVVDVGANVGGLTLEAAAAVGPGGAVWAIEAHPIVFQYLKGNVQLNGFQNVRMLNAAAGASPGRVRFSDMRSDDQNRVVLEGTEGHEVRQDTLDSLLPDDIRVSLLKIDVEGYERFVLDGAEHLLQRTQCVYFESYEDLYNKFGYTCCDVWKVFGARGFGVYRLDGDRLQPIPTDYRSRSCENLIATRDVSAVRARLN